MKLGKFEVAVFGATITATILIVYHFYHKWPVLKIVTEMPYVCLFFMFCLCMAVKLGLEDR